MTTLLCRLLGHNPSPTGKVLHGAPACKRGGCDEDEHRRYRAPHNSPRGIRWRTIVRFAILQTTVAAAFPFAWFSHAGAMLAILALGAVALVLYSANPERGP